MQTTAPVKRKRRSPERSLPLSYTQADRKQAVLYQILLHLIDRCISPEDYEILRKHIFYRLRNYSEFDREDIFSDFVLSIVQTTATFEVWHVNRFILQRLINSINRLKKATSKYILIEDDQVIDTLADQED